MPNTPCSVGAGMSAMSASSTTTNESIQLTKSLFTRVGKCRLMSENYLDIITGLNGCGPTYVSCQHKHNFDNIMLCMDAVLLVQISWLVT